MQSIPKNENPIPANPNSLRRAAVAVATGASLLFIAGCGIERPGFLGDDHNGHTIETDPAAVAEYMQTVPQVRTGEDAIDPAIRADAVSLLGSNGEDGEDRKSWKYGSASLLRRGPHDIRLVTVEHTARSFFGEPAVVQDGTYGVHMSGAEIARQDNKDGRAFVPGFGLIKPAANPIYYNNPLGDYVQDRFTVLPLDQSQSEALEKAEAAGKLVIPELATVEPVAGQVLSTRASGTGQQIPLLYTGKDTFGNYNLVPLMILDQTLNGDAAWQKLQAATDKVMEGAAFRHKVSSSLPESTLEQAQQIAIYDIVSEYDEVDGVASGNKSIMHTSAEWLPCNSENGAPLIDASGNTLGVLSRGEQFLYSDYPFLRKGDDATNACYSQVTSVRIPPAFK